MAKKKSKAKKSKSRRPTLRGRGATPDEGLDRRGHARIPICARIQLNGEERYHFTRDLSVGGLFLLTDHPPEIGMVLKVELAIQYLKEPVALTATVVRHEAEQGRAIGCGLRFEGLDRRLSTLLKGVADSIERSRNP